ncbi:secondary thiamine-phosphate synthase enzyme YjbQ [Rhodothermus profundi]|uniref:Secondary thiamine-phosphate synthase enzyme n=1 Tax=Rhodothermus profundi TaxID=633813 RepID=A0A1M6PHE8_9BACT|nr:secondary thiamine-phosphate synthase enzyme YjbQ [Rhodothermus profundi]SHK07378.1 secondary thiamine-phosphate synthase enzyme [Rhodothermus profundi]
MKTYQETLHRSTSGHGDLQDLTPDVAAVVARSGVQRGLVHIHVVGSTAAIGTIEFEPGLQQDLPAVLDRLIPPGRSYLHERTWHDGNAHSHLQATLIGASVTVPVRDGAPVLGTWQQIVLLECDVRARQREIIVTVQGT